MPQLNIMQLTSLRCTNQKQLTAERTEEKTGKYMTVKTAQASDYALAQASAKGDKAAFKELYERHNSRVYSLCLRMSGNTAKAEDLTEKTFVQLFREIGCFRDESAFTTWLQRLTVNQVLMHLRKSGARIELTT